MRRVWPPEGPFLVSAYIFGDVLNGADPLDNVQVAVAINLAPEEVPCGSGPHGTQWLADQLRLSKGGFAQDRCHPFHPLFTCIGWTPHTGLIW